ncbi:4,5-DOPA-extradiol-dioxygenase [Flectobacillus roseus]|uniref:4,5-DOPA dioxygenase extradiol n=1 Tax=Flectobacillus roseus TaxID=502259 RepID=A0ABT6YG14_9BACT|nr:4,5-DOPA dioxygenase extradiol [Flectobacillus roseus]MDI9862362.1 4,5-DOPA dioxygenase extradiol [Flectobacillus roseus]
MNRKEFLKAMAILPATINMDIKALNELANAPKTERMPAFFLGHGSPMNAIEDNEFSRGWKKIGQDLPKPRAILCISAHWETRGTFVTAMPKPKTIHDFGGFPQALFDVQYPAPGSPSIALETKQAIHSTEVGLDEQWGLDHGAWSVIKHIYPKADVPVLQLSLDYTKAPQYHYDLAKEIAKLRDKGVLIVGSGNIVHNLRRLAWDKINLPEYGYDWALEANAMLKKMVVNQDHKSLINYQSLGSAVQLSAPSPDHYLPLLYTLGTQQAQEQVSVFNDKTVLGAISMTSFKIS